MGNDEKPIYTSAQLPFKNCSACSLGIKEFVECLTTNAKICTFS